MAFSISAYYPAAELKESEFAAALTRMAIALNMAKSQAAQNLGPELEVSFMLACDQEAPGFSGMRMGQFNSQEKRLRFETAVPQRFNHSADAALYIKAALLDAAENAADFLTQQNYLFDVKSHMALVEGLYP